MTQFHTKFDGKALEVALGSGFLTRGGTDFARLFAFSSSAGLDLCCDHRDIREEGSGGLQLRKFGEFITFKRSVISQTSLKNCSVLLEKTMHLDVSYQRNLDKCPLKVP